MNTVRVVFEDRSRHGVRRMLLAAGLGLLLTLSSGCQSWVKPPAISNPLEWFKPKSVESKNGAPQRMVVLWADDVIGQLGKPPTRGFGARIYFYNAEDKPIPVEGQLVIYGYDDSNAQQGAQRAPDRKFVFTPEQFTQHFSESQIGASYSIWVPWDAIDGPRRDISLVPVFTSTSGKIVVGPQTVNMLSARTADGEARYNRIETTKRTSFSPQVQPTTFIEPTTSNQENSAAPSPNAVVNPRPRMRTSSIPLTGAMSERLRNAPPMPALSSLPSPSGNHAVDDTSSAANGLRQPSAGSGATQAMGFESAATPPRNPSASDFPSPLPPGARFEPRKSQAPIWPSVPPTPAAPPSPPSPAESPFLRPSRL